MKGVDRAAPPPPTSSPNAPAAPEPGARAFAWGAWALLTLASAAFVARFGVDIPVWDDYALAAQTAGARPITTGWLWEPHNEHRIPIPKLILLGAGRAAGGDVRVGMALTVATLAALAAALLGLAGRLPGGQRATDAALPLLLLHLGHATNLLWGFQLGMLLPISIGAGFLVPAAGRSAWPGPARAGLTGLAMVVLPLCGGSGLVFVPGLAGWLLVSAAVDFRAGRPRRAAAIALAALPGLAVLAFYFRGFRPAPHPPAPNGVLDALRAGVQFLTVGLGMPAGRGWPWSGLAPLGALGLALALLGRAFVTRPDERPRVVGLLAVLSGLVGLAAGVGWGRGWSGDQAGLQDRYVTMAAPFWCWVAVAFRVYAPPAAERVAAASLLAIACVLAWPNTQVGLDHGWTLAARAEALAADVRAGVPAYRVLKRHAGFLHPNPDEAARFLPILRAAGLGPFGDLRPDPPFREAEIPVTPTYLSMARWTGDTAESTGVDPWLTYNLPAPRAVAGIRLDYSHANPAGGPARFVLTWKVPGQVGESESRRAAIWDLPTGPHRQTTIWVDETIAGFRIQPDNQPCTFRVERITLLEP